MADVNSFLTSLANAHKNNPKTAVAAWLAIAIAFVGGFEGLSLKPYRDSVGVLTVCYGATAADHVDLTKTYTKPECDAMFGADLPKYDAMLQNKCLTPAVYGALPPHRHAALVSFVYNLGSGALCNSAVGRDLNAGNVSAACNAMLAYDHAGGRVLAGLTRRRQAERQLCLRDD
jgi:lysozyme